MSGWKTWRLRKVVCWINTFLAVQCARDCFSSFTLIGMFWEWEGIFENIPVYCGVELLNFVRWLILYKTIWFFEELYWYVDVVRLSQSSSIIFYAWWVIVLVLICRFLKLLQTLFNMCTFPVEAVGSTLPSTQNKNTRWWKQHNLCQLRKTRLIVKTMEMTEPCG